MLRCAPHSASALSMSSPEVIACVRELADRARRLPPPNHRNPDAFHEARSELACDIDKVAEWLKTGRKPG